MLSKFKAEIVSVSIEVAIADVFGIPISDNYKLRTNKQLIEMTARVVPDTFEKYNIPNPVKHVVDRQNAIDFLLADGKSLSIKSDQKQPSKVVPQNIGQPTLDTYLEYFGKFSDVPIPSDSEGQVTAFKHISCTKIDKILPLCWENLFRCDVLLYFYNFIKSSSKLTIQPNVIAFDKMHPPHWDKSKISFTQTPETWNESNTVKYCGVTIGDFQVHSDRNCCKFRFDMRGIIDIITRNII
jgi:hypothetical protein